MDRIVNWDLTSRHFNKESKSCTLKQSKKDTFIHRFPLAGRCPATSCEAEAQYASAIVKTSVYEEHSFCQKWRAYELLWVKLTPYFPDPRLFWTILGIKSSISNHIEPSSPHLFKIIWNYSEMSLYITLTYVS